MFDFFVRIRENNNREKPTVMITMFLVIKIEFGKELFKIFSTKYKNILSPISIISSAAGKCI